MGRGVQSTIKVARIVGTVHKLRLSVVRGVGVIWEREVGGVRVPWEREVRGRSTLGRGRFEGFGLGERACLGEIESDCQWGGLSSGRGGGG